MLSSRANAIIWEEMLSSGANVIIWCYYVILSSVMISTPFIIFPANFTHSESECTIENRDVFDLVLWWLTQGFLPSLKTKCSCLQGTRYPGIEARIILYFWVQIGSKLWIQDKEDHWEEENTVEVNVSLRTKKLGLRRSTVYCRAKATAYVKKAASYRRFYFSEVCL